MRITLLLAVSLLLACGGEGPAQPPAPDASAPDGGGLDAGSEPSEDAGTRPCALGLEPSQLVLFPGQRAAVRLGADGATALAAEAEPGALELSLDGDQLLVAAGTALGEFSVTLRGRCEVGPQTWTLPVEVQPQAFVSFGPWTEGVDGPLAREYGSVWIDPRADRLVVFGGFHYRPRQFTPGRDLWSMDLETGAWRAEAAPGAPWRSGATAATDGQGTHLLYGGFDTDPEASRQTPFSLYRVELGDEVSFQALQPLGAPDHGDYQPSFFYHPPSGRFISACGINDSVGTHCELGAYDPGTNQWSKLWTEGVPPEGRAGHFWAYDAERDRLLIFAGEGWPQSNTCERCLHDTWALDLTVTPALWTQLDAGADRLGRRNGASVWDPEHRRLIVWGGTNDGARTVPGLWAFEVDAARWVELPTGGQAPERTSAFGVYDAARGRGLFGFGNGVHQGRALAFADVWAVPLTPAPTN